MIIDYEFSMWNPEYSDLANYLNEWCLDNANPDESCAIANHLENYPSDAQIEEFTKEYFLLVKGHESGGNPENENGPAAWSMENQECQKVV